MNVALRAPRVLALCAGGGGLELGVRLAVPDARTVCAVEIEATASLVLEARMEDRSLDSAPLWSDLRTFDGAAWRGSVDLVTGGYPCQPFSNAGKRLGAADPRHLWPHVARIVNEIEPEWCFFENVGAHLRLGFREVAGSLHSMGYRVAAVLLTAQEVGAPHGRERLFILAHRDQQHGNGSGNAGTRRRPEPANGRLELADSASYGRHEERATAREDVGFVAASGDCLDSQLADAERSSRSTEPRLEHQERAEVAVSAGCANHGVCRCLPNTGHVPGPLSSSGEPDGAGRGTAASASGVDDSASVALGDTDIARLEGRCISVDGGRDEWLAWPPSPTDDAGWRTVLAKRPDLAPALSINEERELGITFPLAAKKAQSSVRGVADGLVGSVDIARSDQLHILGNGVVPQQAAYALSLLLDALNSKE